MQCMIKLCFLLSKQQKLIQLPQHQGRLLVGERACHTFQQLLEVADGSSCLPG